MEKIDYAALYAVQDRVIGALFSVETSFYLTGGTCLHRFYSPKRYSDDLDFFTNDNQLFRDDLRAVRAALNKRGMACEVVVDSRDFVRLIIADTLKVDLVNDRVHRTGSSIITDQGVRLDNLANIGANKVCAVLSRDEPKDIFDLFTIFRMQGADREREWPAIMAAAAHKCPVDPEELRFRLQSFPLALLDTLPVSDQDFLAEMKEDYHQFVEYLLKAF